jgi:hypothetical protein
MPSNSQGRVGNVAGCWGVVLEYTVFPGNKGSSQTSCPVHRAWTEAA